LIRAEPQSGYFVIGIISKVPVSQQLNEKLQGICIGATINEINQKTQTTASIIVISPEFENEQNLLKELYESLFRQASIVSLSDFYESFMKRIPPFTFSEGWFVANLHEQQKKVYDQFKILVDYFLGVILGIIFIAISPFAALAIKINSKGPIFFCQNRVGRHGVNFKVYKLRTMKVLAADGSAETQGPQFAANDDSRITAVGKFLRKTRIDELPQFINILKGQMSLIGPRPERPEFVRQLTEKMPYYALRHLVKPGLTGWAQIHSAYYGTIEENLKKLEYDLFYIKHRNFTLDASIILRTVATVLKMMGR
ncbi:MAG: sugar transferase, partial [Patescibacteria group bacterium]